MVVQESTRHNADSMIQLAATTINKLLLSTGVHPQVLRCCRPLQHCTLLLNCIKESLCSFEVHSGWRTAGSATNPYNGDGARAVQALLKQAGHVVQRCKEADDRACQAAELLSRRDDIIASFTNEHRILLQLAEQFETTATEMQQKRAIAGT